ncbi:MAG: hypothetical protein ABWX96_12510, partial [Propionibacteriaceae bacterium]
GGSGAGGGSGGSGVNGSGVNGSGVNDSVLRPTGSLASTGAPPGIVLTALLGIAALVTGAVVLTRRSRADQTTPQEGH